jgi:hypothetical protein
VQYGQGLEQSLTDVGQHRARNLAPTHYLRCIKVNRDDFGEGTAEVDEENKGRHLKSVRT